MKTLVLVKGAKLKIDEHFCDKISVKGDLDKLFFFDTQLQSYIRQVEHEGIIEFYGKGLGVVTQTDSMIVISGDVIKYYIYNKDGRLGIIHYLSQKSFS